MAKDYSTEESKTSIASEPEFQYDTLEVNNEELIAVPLQPRTISEEEVARCFTLEEFKQHMDDLVESTHNHATGCVEYTPIVPRVCSFKDAQRRSLTVSQFTKRLFAMVDEFYNTKA